MASKKDKLLESAQRFVLKGQLDKAIKDYQQVVALDPKEIRYRQRLAELLVRDNRKEEAIVQYEDIGKHYAENSYFLKAIAIYKQIQRLAPGNTATSLTIASLNHQQGLTGNALAEYAQVLAQFEKEGALKEAVKVVEKMLDVDAEHAATRLKHAELLFATGSRDDSCQAFGSLLSSLRSGGHGADAESVSARMRQLFPDQQDDPAGGQSIAAALPMASDGAAPSDEAPDASDELPAPWDAEASTTQQAASAPDAFGPPDSPVEPTDAFGQASAAPEAPAVSDAPSAFGAPWGSEAPEPSSAAAAPQVADAPELCSAWEEEIELDLDDDLPGLEVVATPDPCHSDYAAATDPGEIDLVAATDPGEIDLAAAPDADIDLQLDFSAGLDFDEAGDLPDEAPLDLEPQGRCESDPAQEGALELSLPEESGAYGDILWSEEPEEHLEPEAPEAYGDIQCSEELEELEEPEEHLEQEEPEAYGDIQCCEEPEELEEPEESLEPEEHLVAEEPGACFEPGWPDEEVSEKDAVGFAQQLRGWEEIYPGAGDGTDSAIDLEELESHYDLGIGYKEMGLYNGAIKEFDIAAGNPQRRVDCLTLQAICYREKGEPAKAEELLRHGLALDVLSHDERIALSYELAFLFESTGVVDEAIGLYREVNRTDPGFHDVSRRLSALAGEELMDIIELELEEGS